MTQKYLIPLAAVFLLFLVAYTGAGAGLGWFFGIVFPYLAIIAFLVGFVIKVMGWARAAVPFRIPTTCGQQRSLPWIKQNCIDNLSADQRAVIRRYTDAMNHATDRAVGRIVQSLKDAGQ